MRKQITMACAQVSGIRIFTTDRFYCQKNSPEIRFLTVDQFILYTNRIFLYLFPSLFFSQHI
jgi:hypothetical protein